MSARTIGQLLKEFDLGVNDVGQPRVVPFERKTKPAAPSKADDDKRRYDEAFERGREAGYAAALVDLDIRLSDEKRNHADQISREREQWLAERVELTTNGIPEACRALEDSIAGVVARVLEPVLSAAVRQQAITEFVERLSVLMSDPSNPMFRITGPHELLEAVRRKIPLKAVAIDYRLAETKELRVIADKTVIETQMQGWIQRLKEAIR
jgi:hypothetical protein